MNHHERPPKDVLPRILQVVRRTTAWIPDNVPGRLPYDSTDLQRRNRSGLAMQ